MVWRYLRFLGAPQALADDLAQETFVRLIENPIEDRGDAALAGWLRTTARHLFLREGRSPRPEIETLEDHHLEACWQRWNQSNDYHDALEHCLARLTDRQREALALRYRDDASRDSIANELKLKPDGIKTMLRRSREALLSCIRSTLEAAR